MSFSAVNWSWEQKGLSAYEKMVLLALANRHNPDYGCFPSIKKIEEDVEFSEATIKRAIRTLESRNIIRVQKAFRPNGSQTSNRYFFKFEYDTQCQADTPPSATENPLPVPQRHPHKQVIHKQVNEPILRSVDLGFEYFWKEYPRSVGKPHAEKAFKKASQRVGVDKILEAVKPFADSVSHKPKKYIPHPATWLNRDGWNDDLEENEEKSSTDYMESLFKSRAQGDERKWIK